MIGVKATGFLARKLVLRKFLQASLIRRILLSTLTMTGLAVTASPALALSNACTTLNSNSGTTSYSATFNAADFVTGETVTVSFTDNGGDPKTVPEINSAQIRLNNQNSSTVFYRYSSYTGSAGPHFGSHNSLSTNGLSIQINSRTFLSGVTIVCSAPISAPNVTSISPASGTTAGGTAVTITGTNLNGATAVSIGGVAATGVTVVSASSITATTPAHAAGAVNVVVTTPDGTGTLTNSYTFVAPAPPVANAVSETVAANSTGNAIALNITGGVATSVAIGTQAANGTANASGTSITYTPTAGFFGPDSFTYTASNADGTSAAATVSITVRPPVPVLSGISPASGTIAGGTAVTITGTNLTGATGVSIGGVPATGFTINGATSISATTPANRAGAVDIVVTAPGGSGTLANGFTYQPETLVILPASGRLPDGTTANDYRQTLSLRGGTAPFTFSASGSLPSGLGVDPATGEISGRPTVAGSYSFTITVIDANNVTGSASYAVSIVSPVTTLVFTPGGGALADAMVGEEYSQTTTATGGTGSLVYSLASGTLPRGIVLNISTGELTGPTAADAEEKDYAFSIQARDGNGSTGTASYSLTVRPRAVTVTDKVVNIDTGSSPVDVYLNRGATGGPFVQAETTFVEPSNAGTATIIQGQLAQSGPVNTPVGWYLQFTPNPAYSGQARVGFRLTSALGISNTGTVVYNIAYDAGQVESDIDQLVHSFIRTRQSMIASTIHVPGLLERRQMSEATGPVTARMTPSQNGMTLDFSTSLARIQSARDKADGQAGGYSSPFNIWIDGAFLAHTDTSDNGGKWGSFGMLNAGADYLLTEKILFGLSFHYDYMTDPTDEDAELSGNGWLAGPYASFEIGKGVFWNASLRYGGSVNDIDTQIWDGEFRTSRWMADTAIEGQWDIGSDTMLKPKFRAVYFSEKVEDYTVGNGTGDTVIINGFNEEQFRVSLGAEITRSFTLDNGSMLRPNIGVTGGLSGLDGSGAFGALKAGLALQTPDLWMVDASLLFNFESDGDRSIGGRIGLNGQF